MQLPDTLVLVDASNGGTTLPETLLIAFSAALLAFLSSYLLQRHKSTTDLQILREQMRTEFMAEQAVRKLLEHESFRMRSFKTIRRKIAGFDDQELRKLLVRSGAVRFEGDGDDEMWGLISRNDLR